MIINNQHIKFLNKNMFITSYFRYICSLIKRFTKLVIDNSTQFVLVEKENSEVTMTHISKDSNVA